MCSTDVGKVDDRVGDYLDLPTLIPERETISDVEYRVGNHGRGLPPVSAIAWYETWYEPRRKEYGSFNLEETIRTKSECCRRVEVCSQILIYIH